jgi:ubiquinone/menaquinone biosynthesis C-methylase UbiE
MTESERIGHSQDYFGDYRDFWWNPDFVELMATRLGWSAAKRVLDVGCGAGHWTRTIAPYLSPQTRIAAIDNDPKWTDPNASWLQDLIDRGLDLKISAGSAETIPFPDETFDFVTCQTVLIHLLDPQRAISEMLRVLKPGGLLLCAEPDNFGTSLAVSSLSLSLSLDDEAEVFKFYLAQDRGRKALGLGDHSFGGLLPGVFVKSGLSDMQVYLSDKAMPLFSPYSTPEQRALLGDTEHWFESAEDFSRDHSHKLYIAGGGDPVDFDLHWSRVLANQERYIKAVRNGTYHCAGGGLMYLVSGRKTRNVDREHLKR